MKNKKLLSKLKDLKEQKSLESIEGSMLRSLRGGGDPVVIPCQTKCKPNEACNSNH